MLVGRACPGRSRLAASVWTSYPLQVGVVVEGLVEGRELGRSKTDGQLLVGTLRSEMPFIELGSPRGMILFWGCQVPRGSQASHFAGFLGSWGEVLSSEAYHLDSFGLGARGAAILVESSHS